MIYLLSHTKSAWENSLAVRAFGSTCCCLHLQCVIGIPTLVGPSRNGLLLWQRLIWKEFAQLCTELGTHVHLNQDPCYFTCLKSVGQVPAHATLASLRCNFFLVSVARSWRLEAGVTYSVSFCSLVIPSTNTQFTFTSPQTISLKIHFVSLLFC